MLDQHKKFLRRCVHIAKRSANQVKANPNVGALLVHKNTIIGEGIHESFGKAHAEVNAIRSVKSNLKHLISSSTLYVSLEPCNHHGKTGPCTELIKANKIPHVVIAQRDPNLSAVSKGIQNLREAGINVELFDLPEAKELIRPFALGSLNNMPYVILKFAQSKDFFMGKLEKQVWISNKYVQHLVHKWRSEVDAIMVGTNTILIDNPKLTNRLHPGNSPIRIVIDRNKRIDGNYHVKSDNHQTLIYQENTELKSILKDLYAKGIHRLLVEGGATLIKSFVEAQLYHEARIITSLNTLQKGIKAPIISGKLCSSSNLAGDLLQVIKN